MAGRVSIAKYRSAGFTLVELLVVMLIVTLMAGVVVLNMPSPAGRQKSEADIFAAKLDMATELAIMTGTMFGLEIDEQGYQFYRYERGVWAGANERALVAGTFEPRLNVELLVTEPAKKNEQADERRRDEETPDPTVFFSPTGETTPLSVDFNARSRGHVVTLDGAGSVMVARK